MRITRNKRNKIKFYSLLVTAVISCSVPIALFTMAWVNGDWTSGHAAFGLLSLGMLNMVKFPKFRWGKKVNEKSNTHGVRLTNALMDSDLLIPAEPKRNTINLVKHS